MTNYTEGPVAWLEMRFEAIEMKKSISAPKAYTCPVAETGPALPGAEVSR